MLSTSSYAATSFSTCRIHIRIFKKKRTLKRGAVRCLIFVASVSPLEHDLIRKPSQQHGVEHTDLLCRMELPRAPRTHGRTRGRLSNKAGARLLYSAMAIEERANSPTT